MAIAASWEKSSDVVRWELTDKDEVWGRIHWDGSTGDHLVHVEIRSGGGEHPHPIPHATYAFRVADLVSSGVLTAGELSAFMATWRKLRDAAAAACGFTKK